MIAILSCVWQRPERLEYTLRQLGRQTNKDFGLYLINNNPDLDSFVYSVAGRLPFVKKLIQNQVNRGPYARLEAMVKLKTEVDYFMTLDDDCIFDETLVEQWADQANEDAIQGWAGFMFNGLDYWQKERVQSGYKCDYLWGSNLLLPANAVEPVFANLIPKYWQCDDLWLCYCAQTYAALDCKAVDIHGLRINVDGKDSYHSQHEIKSELLNKLRKKGWAV